MLINSVFISIFQNLSLKTFTLKIFSIVHKTNSLVQNSGYFVLSQSNCFTVFVTTDDIAVLNGIIILQSWNANYVVFYCFDLYNRRLIHESK